MIINSIKGTNYGYAQNRTITMSKPVNFGWAAPGGINVWQDDSFETSDAQNTEKQSEINERIDFVNSQAKDMTFRKSRIVLRKGKSLLRKGKRVNFEDLKATTGIGKNSSKLVYGEIDEYTGLPKSVSVVAGNNPQNIKEVWEFKRTNCFEIPYVIHTRFLDDKIIEDKIFEENGYSTRTITNNNGITDIIYNAHYSGFTHTKKAEKDNGETETLFKVRVNKDEYTEISEDETVTIYKKQNGIWTKKDYHEN